MVKHLLFKHIHGMANHVLVPIHALTEDDMVTHIGITPEYFERIYTELGVGKEHFYYDQNNQYHPYCYWDDLFYYSFMTFQEDIFFENPIAHEINSKQDFSIANQFKQSKRHFYQLIENEDWWGALGFTDKKHSFHLFSKLYERIPIEERKPLFLETYQRNEYGFDRLDQNMVRTILQLPTDDKHRIENAGITPDEDGNITIYRGETTKSTSVKKAYSWTLDKKVASFFATRFQSKGRIITAKTNIQHVKAYLGERNESEVIVFPEDINITTIEKVKK